MTTQGQRAEIAGQADEGLTGLVERGVVVGIVAQFIREDRLQAVAQRFFATETDTAATVQAAAFDAAELGIALLAVRIGRINGTVNGSRWSARRQRPKPDRRLPVR